MYVVVEVFSNELDAWDYITSHHVTFLTTHYLTRTNSCMTRAYTCACSECALAVGVRKCARVVVFDLDNMFVILLKDILEIWRVPGTSIAVPKQYVTEIVQNRDYKHPKPPQGSYPAK